MGTNDGRQSREGDMERWSGMGTEAWMEEWEEHMVDQGGSSLSGPAWSQLVAWSPYDSTSHNKYVSPSIERSTQSVDFCGSPLL